MKVGRSMTDAQSALSDEKAALRALMRRRRKAAHDPAAGEALAALIDQLPFPSSSEPTIAFYLPVGSEIDPLPLARTLAARGARTCLPVTLGRDQPLIFRLWREGDPLTADALDIPAPAEAAECVDPDLVLVPLVAFDRFGGRLGQGGGFYDRTLGALRKKRPVLAIGLAFAEQETSKVPSDPLDETLDGVLTPSGFIPAQTFRGA